MKTIIFKNMSKHELMKMKKFILLNKIIYKNELIILDLLFKFVEIKKKN